VTRSSGSTTTPRSPCTAVRLTTPAERRAERLASPTAADNRISYGCINLPPDFFDQVLWPALRHRPGVDLCLARDSSALEQVLSRHWSTRQPALAGRSARLIVAPVCGGCGILSRELPRCCGRCSVDPWRINALRLRLRRPGRCRADASSAGIQGVVFEMVDRRFVAAASRCCCSLAGVRRRSGQPGAATCASRGADGRRRGCTRSRAGPRIEGDAAGRPSCRRRQARRLGSSSSAPAVSLVGSAAALLGQALGDESAPGVGDLVATGIPVAAAHDARRAIRIGARAQSARRGPCLG
jgi:hypothetical protein